MQILHGTRFENPCALCSAVAYCCGAVAPRAIAALLGRFLPRLGPLVHSSGPFFFCGAAFLDRDYSTDQQGKTTRPPPGKDRDHRREQRRALPPAPRNPTPPAR